MSVNLHVLLISGSPRHPSYTCALTEALAAELVGYGAACDHWDPGQIVLPVADPEFHQNPSANPDGAVQKLVALATRADAFVLASPVYHNSYSGVLKNALDHLAIAQFRYKPVALLGHGGNRATHAVEHLRIVVRGLLGVAIPSQLCTAEGDYSVRPSDKLTIANPDISQRLTRVAVELLTFAEALSALRPKRETEFLSEEM